MRLSAAILFTGSFYSAIAGFKALDAGRERGTK
jgi:hypothetical protein